MAYVMRDCPESFVRCLINAKSALVVYEESSLLFCEPCVLLYVVCWSMRRRQKMLSSFSRLTFYGFSSSICLEDTWKKRRKKGLSKLFRLFKIQLIIFVPKQIFSLLTHIDQLSGKMEFEASPTACTE